MKDLAFLSPSMMPPPKKKRQFRRPFKAPIIAPSAIRNYLERELDDWRWIKNVPREELEAVVKEERFKFHTKPHLHQLACWVLGTKIPRFFYLVDMGGGKSFLMLNLIRYRKQRKELKTALICVPNRINLPSWEDQFLLHAPDLTFQVLAGSREKRYKDLDKAFANPPDVLLINYTGLQTYVATDRKQVKGGGQKRSIVAEDLQEFSSLINFLVLDEPHLVLSSIHSLTYDLTKHLSWSSDFCYATTGTPFGRDPIKAFSQFNVVDEGETLGNTLGMFHAAFYTPKENRFSGIQWDFDQSKRKTLNRILQHRSIRYEDKEFSDLPMLMPARRIYVNLTDAQVRRYEDLVESGREAVARGEQEATWIRCRQTASGFIALVGEDEERLEVEFNPNGKALALEQYLLELPDDEKVVIFHEYIPSGRIIQGVLKKLGIKYAGVGSGFRDVKIQRETFMRSPSCRVWVANSKAGATGADGLQRVARHLLFYETPSAPDLRKQAIKRLHRDGQQRRVYVADLVAANVAIDKRILASLAKGQDLFEAVCNGKVKL